MSTPFLQRFASSLVVTLVDKELLEVGPAGPQPVIAYLAAQLSGVKMGSLITVVSRVLVACPDVDELWADDEQLKALVEDMGAGIVRG